MEKSINIRKLIATLYNAYTLLSDENNKSLDELMDIIRDMELVDIVNNTDSICVIGMQGSGKTTLIKNLYGFPEKLLRISDDRGEKIPVFIKEHDSLSSGEFRAKRYFVNKFSGEREEEEIDYKDLANLSRQKGDTIYLELTTAQKYFFSDNGTFVLLPGFEKKTADTFDDNYNALIDCCLHFSKAVLLVADNQNIANSDMDYLIKSLEKHGFDGNNTVFAITKCDSSIYSGYAEEVKGSLKKVLSDNNFVVNDSRIIACDYREETWKDRLTDALGDNATMPFAEKKRDYLRPMIDKILHIINNIETDIKSEEMANLLRREDCAIVNEIKAVIKTSRDNLEKDINNAIKNAQEETDKNIEHFFEDSKNQKKLKDKYFGIFGKKLSTINYNHNKIREGLCVCAIDETTHENILHKKIVENLSSEKLEACNIPYLSTENYNSILALCDGENTELATEEIPEERIKKCEELVASYFKTDIVQVNDSEGKPLIASDKDTAKLIVSSFNSSFITFYSGNGYLEKDTSSQILKDCEGGIRKTVKKVTKNKDGKLGEKTALFAAFDMLDGHLDVAPAVAKAVQTFLKTPAGPYVAAAAAAAGIASAGVVAFNHNVKVAQATQDAAKRAILNQMYEQRDTILDKYDDAADKMIEYLNDIYNRKNNIDSNQTRIRNANDAIQGIKAICQDVFDEHAKLLRDN